MKHIRYLSDNKTLCLVPRRLGHDHVVLDTEPAEGETCIVCSDLLFTHNMREYERESRTEVVMTLPSLEEDDLTVARGVIIALVVSSFFWIVAFLLVYYSALR